MTTTTELDQKARATRSKKLLLWFAMISIIMVFAGLTSAYVVSKSRPDWKPFDMPSAFFVSTTVMLVSSLTFFLSKRTAEQGRRSRTTLFLLLTLLLGLTFVYFQFEGFHQLFLDGLYPAGAYATVTVSFLWVMVLVHLAHLSGGLISLLVIIYNHFKQKYGPGQTVGIELGAIFWHFLDFLWLYLFLFLYFFK